MNERIRQLAEQAGFIDRGSNHTAYMSFYHEKFAELIIQECVGICMIEYDTGLEPAPQAPQIARQIKQHFGV